MYSPMRALSEYNPKLVGLIGTAIVAAIVVGSLEFDKIPFLNSAKHYSAYFSEAGGLSSGASVQVAGYGVGTVTDLSLDGDRVRVEFTVERDIHLGERTEAAIETKTLLGARILAVTPRGGGELSVPIPLERTISPYELPTALGDLASTINDLDTGTVNNSLTTLAQTFRDTPADVSAAVQGVARFSDALAQRDDQLRQLLVDANKSTAVLSQRSTQLVQLVADGNALMAELRTQSGALSQISGNISQLAQQISGLAADQKERLRPALDKLNGVLVTLDNRKTQLAQSIKMFAAQALSLGEAVSGGPFFKNYMANLVPGQFMQPFVDAAFSDLGLDPNTLLPSQLTDPQIGQPGTPALPVPFPRTGQGGPPRLNLPDAITGTPGDPRYPYRAPEPQPPAGGPPPGPPAGYDPNAPAQPPTEPTSTDLAPPPAPPSPLPKETR